jgi:hypothetical protein
MVARMSFALVLVLAGCERPDRTEDAQELAMRTVGALEGTGRLGMLRFELELEPSRPSVGELFRVITTVRDARSGAPVEDASFVLDAAMPAHGHGMSTRPEHRPLGHGRYLSEGMKFHMPGAWEITASASVGPLQDTIVLEYMQPVTKG